MKSTLFFILLGLLACNPSETPEPQEDTQQPLVIRDSSEDKEKFIFSDKDDSQYDPKGEDKYERNEDDDDSRSSNTSRNTSSNNTSTNYNTTEDDDDNEDNDSYTSNSSDSSDDTPTNIIEDSPLEIQLSNTNLFSIKNFTKVKIEVDNIDDFPGSDINFFVDSECDNLLVSEQDNDDFDIEVPGFGELTLYTKIDTQDCQKSITFTIKSPETQCEDNPSKKYGLGTEEAPYTICNEENFIKTITQNPSKHFVLGQNIDLSEASQEWTPLEEFTGSLNGRDHKIINFKIDNTETDQGIFSKINNATIKNLILGEKTDNTCDPECTANVKSGGILAGEINNSTLSRILNNISIKGSNHSLGGLAAISINVNGELLENTATIQSGNSTNVGGLFGVAENTDLKFVKNSGEITSENNSRSGGFIGFSTTTLSSLSYALNTGDINGYISGGLIGSAERGATIEYSENKGNITATDGYAGGAIGLAKFGPDSESVSNFESNINEFHNSGKVISTFYAGGAIGELMHTNSDEHALEKVINSGIIQGYIAGGLIGQLNSNPKISFSYIKNLGDIESANAGGLFNSERESGSIHIENFQNEASFVGFEIGKITPGTNIEANEIYPNPNNSANEIPTLENINVSSGTGFSIEFEWLKEEPTYPWGQQSIPLEAPEI